VALSLALVAAYVLMATNAYDLIRWHVPSGSRGSRSGTRSMGLALWGVDGGPGLAGKPAGEVAA